MVEALFFFFFSGIVNILKEETPEVLIQDKHNIKIKVTNSPTPTGETQNLDTKLIEDTKEDQDILFRYIIQH